MLHFALMVIAAVYLLIGLFVGIGLVIDAGTETRMKTLAGFLFGLFLWPIAIFILSYADIG